MAEKPVELTGSVGVVRPGSWWRNPSKKIDNLASDQEKLINLLKKIPASSGGKKEAFANTAFVLSNGTCDSKLAEAIYDFQQYWKARGFFQNIDGVADPRAHTIDRLNELADDKPDIGLIADIVVRFQGARD